MAIKTIITGAWFALAGIIADAASDRTIGRPLNSPSRNEVIDAMFAETPDQWPWEVIEIPGFFLYARNPDHLTRAFCQQLHLAVTQMEPLSPAESLLAANGKLVHVIFAGLPTTPESWRSLGNPGAASGQVFVIADPPISEVQVPASFLVNQQIKRLQLASLMARLLNRTPSTPSWLIDGLAKVLESVVVSDAALWLAPMAIAAGDAPALLVQPVLVAKDGPPTSRSIEFPPGPTSDRVVINPSHRTARTTRTYLEIPMSTVFENAGRGSKRGPPIARKQRWQFFQSVLFVRWALAREEARRDAFWRFARAACDGPVTDAMFQDHFGMSLDDLDHLLNATLLAHDGWLPVMEIPIDRAKIRGLPRIETRPASDAEMTFLKRELQNQPAH